MKEVRSITLYNKSNPKGKFCQVLILDLDLYFEKNQQVGFDQSPNRGVDGATANDYATDIRAIVG